MTQQDISAPTPAAPGRRTRTHPAGWAAFALSVAGVLVSAYLTFEHFTASTTLACSDNGVVNCQKVTSSTWSQIAGVPVALAGLAFFLAMMLLCAPTRWAARTRAIRLIGVLAGTAMVLWLIYVELFLVDAICLWCTAVHAITVLLLGTVLWWQESTRALPRTSRAHSRSELLCGGPG